MIAAKSCESGDTSSQPEPSKTESEVSAQPHPSLRARVQLDGTSLFEVPYTERREGGERSEPSDAERGARGESGHGRARRAAPSAQAVVGQLLNASAFSPSATRQYLSVTLTTRTGLYPELAAKAVELQAIINHRLPTGGALIALDLKKERWHLHLVVVAPAGFEGHRLLSWWVRLWPRGKSGPLMRGQYVRTLDGRPGELRRVLEHHLRGPRRERVKGAGVPRMADRVLTCGSLCEPWARLLPWVKGEVTRRPSHAPQVPSRPSKVSADAYVGFPRLARRGRACGWCGERFAIGTRTDCQFHNGCRQSASRGLKQLIDGEGPTAAQWVREFEAMNLLRPDAMKLTKLVMRLVPWLSPGALPRKYALRLFPRCHCGRPLAFRPDSKTCGRPFCRLKRPSLASVDEEVVTALNALKTKSSRKAPEVEAVEACCCRTPEPVAGGRVVVCGACLLLIEDVGAENLYQGYPREVRS